MCSSSSYFIDYSIWHSSTNKFVVTNKHLIIRERRTSRASSGDFFLFYYTTTSSASFCDTNTFNGIIWCNCNTSPSMILMSRTDSNSPNSTITINVIMKIFKLFNSITTDSTWVKISSYRTISRSSCIMSYSKPRITFFLLIKNILCRLIYKITFRIYRQQFIILVWQFQTISFLIYLV